MNTMKRLGLIALVFLFSAGFLFGYGTSTSTPPLCLHSTWDAFLAKHEINLLNGQIPLRPLAEKRDGLHLSGSSAFWHTDLLTLRHRITLFHDFSKGQQRDMAEAMGVGERARIELIAAHQIAGEKMLGVGVSIKGSITQSITAANEHPILSMRPFPFGIIRQVTQ